MYSTSSSRIVRRILLTTYFLHRTQADSPLEIAANFLFHTRPASPDLPRYRLTRQLPSRIEGRKYGPGSRETVSHPCKRANPLPRCHHQTSSLFHRVGGCLPFSLVVAGEIFQLVIYSIRLDFCFKIEYDIANLTLSHFY